MSESLACAAPNKQTPIKLWPIYSAPQTIERTVDIDAETFEFAQDVVSTVCSKIGVDPWRLTSRFSSRNDTRARAWFVFFLRNHPFMTKKDRRWESVAQLVDREFSTVIFHQKTMIDRLTDARFSAEAYGLKEVARQLTPRYGTFDIAPFMGVERRQGMRP